MITLGIDPGMSGAICAIKGHHSVDPLVGYRLADRAQGYMSKPVDETAMLRALRSLVDDLGGGRVVVVLEQQRAGRKQGVSSTFSTGVQFGIWRGLLAVLGWPVLIVTPQRWRKAAGIVVPSKGDPKAATIAHVRRVLPDLDLIPTARSRTPHDGLADAAGMALAGRALVALGQL